MTLSKHQIAILIPAHNEERNILKVINDFNKFGEVFIVDDNSTDKTNLICKKKKVYLIKNNLQIGYDYSLRKGINYIINKKRGIKIIITADGDGQHEGNNVKKFLKFYKKYDCIIGARDFFNRFSELLLNFFSTIFFDIKDPLSGMKCYNTSILRNNKFIFKSKNDYCGMFFF